MKHMLMTSVLLAAATCAGPAFAQAAIPFGFWTTADNVSRLQVDASGCSFFAVGGAQLAGNCSWDPSYRGGILTIWIPAPYAPAGSAGVSAVRYDIVYVNNTSITVWGEPFFRR